MKTAPVRKAPVRSSGGVSGSRGNAAGSRGSAASSGGVSGSRGNAAGSRGSAASSGGVSGSRDTVSGSRGSAASSGGVSGSRGTVSGSRGSVGSRSARVPTVLDNARTSRAQAGRRDNTRVVGNRSVLRIPPRRYDIRRRYRPISRVTGGVSISFSFPRIHAHIWWPWTIRLQHHWTPRYRYRQVVYVEAGWSNQRRESRIELETTYQHRVMYADDNRAELEISVEEITLYRDGRYLGTVDRIPADLSRIAATVYSNGDVTFDRDVFLIGDPETGFELISTRFYQDQVLDAWRANDGIRVGVVTLGTGSVRPVRSSRLFNPNRFNGYVPISLLPDEDGWLWDTGAGAISAVYDDYGAYYGPDARTDASFGSEAVISGSGSLDYNTSFGASIRVNRESSIQRIE